ncbi:hypothetical protein BT67DRAFT_443058 [Trichocladium antarcticum]|uniref:Secreted protein n=1 Tax=Trichocladium antarcticum TaxID=1450529 RepID=A0AAN6UHI7_9PEZI|nr:hypothetical protein BT67DRAFT_443058 [Trichocladium antarcticum]
MHLCLTWLCNLCLTSPFLVAGQRNGLSTRAGSHAAFAIQPSVARTRLFVVRRWLPIVPDPTVRGRSIKRPMSWYHSAHVLSSPSPGPPFMQSCIYRFASPVVGHTPHDLQTFPCAEWAVPDLRYLAPS